MGSSPVRAPRTRRRTPLSLPTAGLVLMLASPAFSSPAFGPRDYVLRPGLPLVALERFPACQPEKGGRLRVENGPGGRPRATLAVLVLNQQDTVVMAEGGGLRRVVDRAVPLAASNTLLVWMIGSPGATLGVSVSSAGACLDVAITSPLPGAYVPEGPLLVQGTVTAPGPAGVSVNGFPALLHRTEWAVRIPADASVQSLTATASVVGGESASAAIAISVAPAPAGSVELHAGPVEGVAPLTVTWKVVNNTGRALLQYELDPTGGGAFEPPVPSLDDAQATYATAGLWFPSLRVLDDQGVTHTAATALLVSDPAAVSARFDALWAAFRARLRAGDAAGGLAFLAPALRPRMERVFQELGPDLPTVAGALGDLQVTDQVDELAEAVLVQDEPTGRQLYFIQFRRDSLGRWLIEEM